MIWDPICLVPGSPKDPKPQTYANPCYAGCKGQATSSSLYYKGACQPTCDVQCAKVRLAHSCVLQTQASGLARAYHQGACQHTCNELMIRSCLLTIAKHFARS